MADSSQGSETSDTSARPGEYLVVARRYRPQTFDELVGQEHVARALSNAITTNRVGHAYLFTGARGVGKTSAARILAKALNCERGMQPCPCNECDICEAISRGGDVDVLEIDGASNRGIEEVRQLRQNANVRPSRARFKIYIIDEVHMLTREAFNALLKTLEEPPEHVKFIFCTTEPSKIPITILSRCQRFDFAGITTGSILTSLRHIAAVEGVRADDAALEVIARRAAGSMRDGQSLLEQLLAFGSGEITVADVHGMLGTAGDERILDLLGHLVERNAAAVLADLDTALESGVDAGQLLEQLAGWIRDCMVAAVGCPAETFLYASTANQEQIASTAKSLGLETIFAILQILDQTLARMRVSTQSRILAELALTRICNLEDLESLPELIARVQSGVPAGGAAGAPSPGPHGGENRGGPKKKSAEPAPSDPGAEAEPASQQPSGRRAGAGIPLTAETAAEVWTRALDKVSGMAAEHARQFERITIAAPNRLVVHLKPGYDLAKSVCEKPDQLARIEKAVADVAGQVVRVEFVLSEAESAADHDAPARPQVSLQEQMRELSQQPLMQRASDLFGVQPIRVDPPDKN